MDSEFALEIDVLFLQTSASNFPEAQSPPEFMDMAGNYQGTLLVLEGLLSISQESNGILPKGSWGYISESGGVPGHTTPQAEEMPAVNGYSAIYHLITECNKLC